jgi:hypothetical protein
MAYLITKSDGTTLTTVSDGQIDDLSTDLTLIGKNYSGFGEAFNENLIKLLENFASTARPTRPIRGQIWFDVTELKLKVYNGTAFQPVSSATIAATQPTSLTPGDLWFDDTNKQLYFYDGENTLLLGPSYGLAQGLSGIRVSTILDTLNQSKVITSLYNNGTLIGIFSSAETEFTPKIPISGFSGTITPGFNAGTISGIKFNVTATNSETLGKDAVNYPNGIPASLYVRRDTSTVVTGKLGISDGIEVGTGYTGRLLSNNGELLLQNVALNKPIKISANRGNIQDDVITIEPSSQSVNIYNGFLASETTVGGNLTVKGDLTVEGNTVAVDVSTLRVENKQIELGTSADSSILTNEQADGGGLILRSSGIGGDKEIYWSLTNDAWTFNQNLNLEINKSIRIGGVELLKYNEGLNTYELTNSVTRATGINIFGVQSEWTVDNVFTNTNRISIINSAGDLELEPTAGNNVSLVGLPRITGVGDPLGSQDATTKNYVDTQLKAKSLALSFDISDGISNNDIAIWLTQIAPIAEYGNGTIARIVCTYTNNLSTDIDPLLNDALNKSSDTFNTFAGTASALTDISFNTVTIPAPAVSISRIVKTYQIIASAWTFVS